MCKESLFSFLYLGVMAVPCYVLLFLLSQGHGEQAGFLFWAISVSDLQVLYRWATRFLLSQLF